MPPKKGQAPRDQPKAKADNVNEAPLQAVVLADSYNRRFEVLCQDQPRVLLPLCSTPLLAWTLESLSLSKVRQVFVFCGVHADKIRAFIESSPYRHTLDIQCLSSQTAMSAGDALRELDDMHVLNPENPFVLVHSPIVSNYDLSKMIEVHKQRREVDKNFIMTMEKINTETIHRYRRHPESPIMLVHPPSSRLLHYAPHPLSPSQPRAAFPSSLFLDPFPTSIDTYEIWSGTPSSSSSNRGGYRDLGVDICEADVPALCTENFDYHDMRRHFVNGVLTSELLGKKIAVHVVGKDDPEIEEGKGDVRSGAGGNYIERVRDTRTFGEISRDVLRRWAFPLAPDMNEPGGVQYELRTGNVYVARDNVVLSRTTTLNGPLLIGPRSALAHNTHIHQSTLGADCSIGPNTTVTQSYVFDDVRIGANCTLRECVIGEGVVLHDDVKIGRGALLGNGVSLGRGTVVPEFARIGKERYRGDGYDTDEDEEEDEDEKDRRLQVLGPDSIGYLWPNEEEEPPSDSEDEADDPYEHPRNKKLLQLGRRLSNLSSTDVSLSTLSKASSEASSPESIASSASLPDMPTLSLDSGPPAAFFDEARDSLRRAYEEDHKNENAIIEFRTLVLSYNAGLDRAREEIVKFFLSKIDANSGAAGVLKSTTAIFTRWGPLAHGFTSDLTNIVLDAQAFCVNNSEYTPWFGIILRGLYESDTLGEEELIEWRSLSAARGEGTKDEEEKKKWVEVFGKGKAYVDVLEQMESDDDDDDEDDDDEDEDDEEEESDDE
ncbi:translation initiation factor eIF-2B subunit epsilon [Kwoniella heveanensis BCC8398]|uniref:Translation initiation factor eIF2B subunit epsilon n=1 Tax=Kwoniella heveanensis BCC8398 TaxID=1296120 RepID=A0A1B9GV51_9TREE|nr:translation initiation factor eIF-2B subunit epsilon [Kwoniella heveanensis BCC8398]